MDLSELLKVDKTTTTKAIQKLIEAGYIEKKRDDFDKRIWRLYPEEKIVVRKLIKKMSSNIEKSWADTVKNKRDSGGNL